ncbi:MAG: type II secretion system F family protein [Candidatus Omnitrophica bacterium]|jgi:type IV pilus assembly protein PilC|nr:type II secretion system F family protein [Candidatus Omnitrophota bacterium]MDD5078817.1 type II secretion system F family protein [Candidatus Omnitrophota bacterium]
MPSFQYVAKDYNGRPVVGVVDAPNDAEAANILHNKSYTVVSVKEVKAKAFKMDQAKIKMEDLVVFSRQLATMIDAGIPLVQALGILGEQVDNKSLKAVVMTVRQDIEAGMSFCDALSKHPTVFSELFINMSRAGEASGMLDEILDRLASYLEKTASLQRKINSSLVYPEVVICMALLITAVLLIKVVPTFKGIFDMLGGKLPLPTQILIMVSELVRKNFIYGAVVLAVVAFAFKKYISTPKGKYNFDKTLLKLPVLGVLFQKVAVAKFSRTFSTLVKSGVAVLNALDIVGKTSGNKVVEEAVANCRIAVRDGEPIATPLAKSQVFPPIVTRMIGVGEQTGQLEKMLTKIADFYDDQVDAAVAGMTSLIEPLVIAFLGVVIGGIVIALFLPIFKITELIAK